MRRAAPLLLAGLAVVDCGGSSGGGGCFADSDGLTGGQYAFDIEVDDGGFSKDILSAQNAARVTLTLKNTGSRAHGFEVECRPVRGPAGCPAQACFPSASTISPLAPGDSKTVVFDTPMPEGIYQFRSSAPSDADVTALNEGQFVVM